MEGVTAITIHALRVFFIIGVPLLVAAVCGGALASLLQGFIAMNEPSVTYAARLGAITLALYFLTPTIISTLQDLLVAGLGGG